MLEPRSRGVLDRPVIRGAMTVKVWSCCIPDMPSRSRGAICPRFALRCPSEKREQGMPGARCTRGLVCKFAQRKAHTSIQVQRRQSGIPCAMALRLMPCSPRRRIRLVTVAAGLRLTRSGWIVSATDSSASATDVGTTRFCRTRLASFVLRAGCIAHEFCPPCDHLARRRCHVHRIPSRVRDDRDTPLSAERTGRAGRTDLPDRESEIFLLIGLDRFPLRPLICPSGQFVAAELRRRLNSSRNPSSCSANSSCSLAINRHVDSSASK